VPIAVGAWVVADDLLALLFGDAFAPYGDLMRLVFVAYAGHSVMRLLTALVIARRHYRLQAVASGSLLGVNVLLNAALLPSLGMRGAALATAASSVVGGLVLLVEALRAGCARGLLMALLRAALASIPMALAARVLLPCHVALAIAVGAALYLPTFVAVGGLGPGGAVALRRWLRERRERGEGAS
jgi:O-antigen/teichoic acid export membrane protein